MNDVRNLGRYAKAARRSVASRLPALLIKVKYFGVISSKPRVTTPSSYLDDFLILAKVSKWPFSAGQIPQNTLFWTAGIDHNGVVNR